MASTLDTGIQSSMKVLACFVLNVHLPEHVLSVNQPATGRRSRQTDTRSQGKPAAAAGTPDLFQKFVSQKSEQNKARRYRQGARSPALAMKPRSKGLLIILVGVICVSPDAVLVRYLTEGSTPVWTIIFWKLLLSIPISAGFALWEAGGLHKLYQSVKVGRFYYAVAAPVQAVTDICFTFAFVYTSAANALLLINLNPLWCAVIGRVFLGDMLPRRTNIALVLALCCVIIIFVPEVVERKKQAKEDGADGEDDPYADTAVKGNIISLVTGLLLAVYIAIVRLGGKSDKEINLVGAAALGASLSSIIAVSVERGDVFPSSFWTGKTAHFWLAVAGQGIGIGTVFVAIGLAPRYITGAEVGLCILLEAILGPLFVWLAYRDVPSKWTLIGGSLLLLVLALHESRPLFEKAKEVQRSVSRRISSIALRASTMPTTIYEAEETNGGSKNNREAALEKISEAGISFDLEGHAHANERGAESLGSTKDMKNVQGGDENDGAG